MRDSNPLLPVMSRALSLRANDPTGFAVCVFLCVSSRCRYGGAKGSERICVRPCFAMQEGGYQNPRIAVGIFSCRRCGRTPERKQGRPLCRFASLKYHLGMDLSWKKSCELSFFEESSQNFTVFLLNPQTAPSAVSDARGSARPCSAARVPSAPGRRRGCGSAARSRRSGGI